MITNQLTVAILTKALALLRTYGWIQGKFGGTQNGFCTVGALYEASYKLRPGNGGRDAIRLVQQVIADKYPGTVPRAVTQWNDIRGRTFAEVETVLEKAITRASQS